MGAIWRRRCLTAAGGGAGLWRPLHRSRCPKRRPAARPRGASEPQSSLEEAPPYWVASLPTLLAAGFKALQDLLACVKESVTGAEELR